MKKKILIQQTGLLCNSCFILRKFKYMYLSVERFPCKQRIFIPAHLSSLEKTFFKTVYILLKIWYLQVFMRIMITWSQTGMMVDWSTLMNVSSATPRTRLTWKTRPNQMMFFISSVDYKNIRGCLTIRAAYCSTCTTETVAWKVKSYSETRWGKVNKTLL